MLYEFIYMTANYCRDFIWMSLFLCIICYYYYRSSLFKSQITLFPLFFYLNRTKLIRKKKCLSFFINTFVLTKLEWWNFPINIWMKAATIVWSSASKWEVCKTKGSLIYYYKVELNLTNKGESSYQNYDLWSMYTYQGLNFSQ